MLKQKLSQGLFSYQLRSPNEVTPSRILRMLRMVSLRAFEQLYMLSDEGRLLEWRGQNGIHLCNVETVAEGGMTRCSWVVVFFLDFNIRSYWLWYLYFCIKSNMGVGVDYITLKKISHTPLPTQFMIVICPSSWWYQTGAWTKTGPEFVAPYGTADNTSSLQNSDFQQNDVIRELKNNNVMIRGVSEWQHHNFQIYLAECLKVCPNNYSHYIENSACARLWRRETSY